MNSKKRIFLVRVVNLISGKFIEKETDELGLDWARVMPHFQVLSFELIREESWTK